MHDAFEGEDVGFDLWDRWSSQGAAYRSHEMPSQWASFDVGGGVGWGTVVHLATAGKGGGITRYTPLPDVYDIEGARAAVLERFGNVQDVGRAKLKLVWDFGRWLVRTDWHAMGTTAKRVVNGLHAEKRIGWQWNTVKVYRKLARYEWSEIPRRCTSIRSALAWQLEQNPTPDQLDRRAQRENDQDHAKADKDKWRMAALEIARLKQENRELKAHATGDQVADLLAQVKQLERENVKLESDNLKLRSQLESDRRASRVETLNAFDTPVSRHSSKGASGSIAITVPDLLTIPPRWCTRCVSRDCRCSHGNGNGKALNLDLGET